jgi:hypothetical protein
MEFRYAAPGQCWLGEGAGTTFYLDGPAGAVPADQAAAAERIAGSLAAFRDRAAAYLDLFVDRAKACGSADEDWYLVEIHMRGGQGKPVRARPLLMLDGDDGGMWSVELRDTGDDWWPVRFERDQG